MLKTFSGKYFTTKQTKPQMFNLEYDFCYLFKNAENLFLNIIFIWLYICALFYLFSKFIDFNYYSKYLVVREFFFFFLIYLPLYTTFAQTWQINLANLPRKARKQLNTQDLKSNPNFESRVSVQRKLSQSVESKQVNSL